MSKNMYYVGIGASAGGLEALELFFKSMPSHSNHAFIVVQHLSPDYKSLMNELLARHTEMPIYVIEDQMVVEPNTIYLIPPRKNLSIFHGVLYLDDQKKDSHIHLPIDHFFNSLAKDRTKNAVGIILSGTGSDGTTGIRAIKEYGGMVMVQTESTAKFNGMTQSAISTGVVDYILSPDQMPQELIHYTEHPSVLDQIKVREEINSEVNELSKVCLILRQKCGVDFSAYKENTLIRRIERRLKVRRLTSLSEYIDFLKESDKEKDILKRELLIGVTTFFRDKEAFQSLVLNAFPKIDFQKGLVRVWIAGCSTGEEVYTLAMLINDYIEANQLNCEVKIFATDIDEKSLEIASNGFYYENLMAEVDKSWIHKYFIKKDEGFYVVDAIRSMVVFAHHNVLKDPPFSKLDLLICRNLFIYFKSEYQQQVLKQFYYSLAPKGILFLGSSESLGEMSQAFKSLDQKWKIFQYREGYIPQISLPLNYQQKSVFREPSNRSVSSQITMKMEKILVNTLTKVIPPSILINDNEQIVHVFGLVSPFIQSQTGRFSNHFNANMDKELALFVNNMIRRLKNEKQTILLKNISLKNLPMDFITIKGLLVEENESFYYLISFILEEKKASDHYIAVDFSEEAKERVKHLETELQHAREGLQATIEELETSNEELQSSNEELIASNEELQSTNEELQSVNEELYTVNNEHQIKIEELVRLNNDLNNLLKITDVGALFLDKKLCIRKVTPVVSTVTNILQSDIGRPIQHLAALENYPEILQDIEDVLNTLQGKDRILMNQGKAWLTKIRPYRTEYNAVEGIIITFIEVNKIAEEGCK